MGTPARIPAHTVSGRMHGDAARNSGLFRGFESLLVDLDRRADSPVTGSSA